MTGDVDGFADEEQAGHGARLHGARVEAVGVDAACGYFGLSETFRAGGMKLPVVQPAFAGLEGGGGPAIGGGDVNQSICEALRSMQSIRSRVNPLAGPGATPSRRARPASRTALMPSHTAALE